MKRKFLLTTAFAAFGMMYDAASAMLGGNPGFNIGSAAANPQLPNGGGSLAGAVAGIAAQAPQLPLRPEEYLEAFGREGQKPVPQDEIRQRVEELRAPGQNVRGPAVGALDSIENARKKVIDLLEKGYYEEVDDYFAGTGANAFGFANIADADVSKLRKASDGLKAEAAGAPELSALGGVEYVCMAITGDSSANIEGLTPRNYKRLAFGGQIKAYRAH